MNAKLTTSFPRLIRNDDGGSLIEFALIAPLLLLLLLGIVDIGRYMAYSVTVGNAVRAGAQIGASDGAAGAYATPFPGYANSNVDYAASQAACNDAGIPCVAAGGTPSQNELAVTSTQFCTYSGGSPNTSCPSGTNRAMFIQVKATGTFTPLVHYPLLPATAPISATAIVQVGQ